MHLAQRAAARRRRCNATGPPVPDRCSPRVADASRAGGPIPDQLLWEAARRWVAGESLRAVVHNVRPGGAGDQWPSSPRAWRRALTNYGSATVCPPRLAAALRIRLAHPEPPAPRTYPLSQRVVCGNCRERMIGRADERGRRRYVCARGSGAHTAIVAEQLERHVSEALLSRLERTFNDATVLLIGVGADLRRVWTLRDVQTKTALFNSALAEVVVVPAARQGRGFDQGRIRIRWS